MTRAWGFWLWRKFSYRTSTKLIVTHYPFSNDNAKWPETSV